MAFNLKGLSRLVVNIEYKTDDQVSERSMYQTIAENLEKSTLSEIRGLEIESLEARWFLDAAEKAMARVPFITLKKGRIGFDVGRDGLSVRIPPRYERTARKSRILLTKSILREASEILNRILLSHAGISKKTEIETKITAAFSIKSKVQSLNHMLNTTYTQLAEKKGYDTSLKTGEFVFRSVENDKEISYEVRIGFPEEDTSGEPTELALWTCNMTTIGPLEGFDLNSIVTDIIAVSKQMSSFLGV